MTNLVKQSLQDNMSEILESLPEEFHSDFKSSVESAAPAPKLTMDEAKELAAELMKENPSISEKECIPLLDADSSINQPIQQPKPEELELQKQHSLSEVESGLSAE